MGYPGIFFYFFALILTFLPSFSYSQIIFKELPGYKFNYSEKDLLDLTEYRKVISLDGNWQVFAANDKEQKRVTVGVPSVFQGDGVLVFEKSFPLSKEQLNNNKFKICFLGLNYSADISVNNVIIYRHTGGQFPFSLDLPKDIINTDRRNVLSVKLLFKPDAENTIPVKQGFLIPKNFGGMFGDVYLQLMPNVSIKDPDVSYKFDPKTDRAKFQLSAKIENKDFYTKDTVQGNDQLSLKVLFQSPSGSAIAAPEQNFILSRNKEKYISQEF